MHRPSSMIASFCTKLFRRHIVSRKSNHSQHHTTHYTPHTIQQTSSVCVLISTSHDLRHTLNTKLYALYITHVRHTPNIKHQTLCGYLPVGIAGLLASMYSGGVPLIQPMSCCRGDEDNGLNIRTCNSCAPGTVGRWTDPYPLCVCVCACVGGWVCLYVSCIVYVCMYVLCIVYVYMYVLCM